jgi:hypothetical protein
MLKAFSTRLDMLPEPQRKLWPEELAGTPDHFILYRGTAIALRLGHRHSVDFDFFSPATFEPDSLLKTVPYFKGATVRKSAPNDLAVTLDRGGPVQLSFFGNFDLGQVAEPELAALLTKSGIPLATMLAAAAAIYGDQFSPLLSLKAIAYHDDPNLVRLPPDARHRLSAAVQKTDPAKLPALNAVKPYIRSK